MDIELDNQGNIYVFGHSNNGLGGKDFLLRKYDTSGNTLWTVLSGSESSSKVCEAADLTINANDDIVFVGSRYDGLNSKFYISMFNQAGKCQFIDEFSRNAPNNVASTVVTIGDEIYVSGISELNSIEENITVKFNLIEKIVNYVTDASGNALYEANDLIVRFDQSILKMSAFDNTNREAGLIIDFIQESFVTQIKTALRGICSEECEIKAYKIFRDLTNSTTHTTTRTGDTILVPDFWASLILEFPSGVDILQVKTNLESLFPMIIYADANLVAQNTATADDTFYATEQASLHPTANFPNAHINVEEAWEYETGKPFINVGVYDDGLDWRHEDFGNGVWQQGKSSGYDFYHNITLQYTPFLDVATHGTRCAGIIGAIRNNGQGVAGIAGGGDNSTYNVDSMGVSLFGFHIEDVYNVNVDFATLYNAIIMTTFEPDGITPYRNDIDIQNHSWYIHSFYNYFVDSNINMLREAVRFIHKKEVTIVASRGNFGNDAIGYPACFDDNWVLCVGATGTDGQFIQNGINGTYTSNYGGPIDLGAPGDENIIRTTYRATNPYPLNYSSFNGTSAAAPHVVGVASLLMSYLDTDPASGLSNFNNLAPEDVEYILQMTATDNNYPGLDTLSGYGLVNAGEALKQVEKGKHYLEHFDSETFVSNETLTALSTGDTITIEERFENVAGTWFLPGAYVVNTFKVEEEVFHNLPILDSIVAAWPRHSGKTNVFPLFDANNVLLPHDSVSLDSIDNGSAHLSGFVYEVFDLVGTPLGWWPINPFVYQLKTAYTILRFDPFYFASNEEIESNNMVQVYPNPTDGVQSIVLDLPAARSVKIELYDISGRHLLEVFDGQMNSGKNKIVVPLSLLPKGMYVYHFLIDGESSHKKMTIK